MGFVMKDPSAPLIHNVNKVISAIKETVLIPAYLLR